MVLVPHHVDGGAVAEFFALGGEGDVGVAEGGDELCFVVVEGEVEGFLPSGRKCFGGGGEWLVVEEPVAVAASAGEGAVAGGVEGANVDGVGVVGEAEEVGEAEPLPPGFAVVEFEGVTVAVEEQHVFEAGEVFCVCCGALQGVGGYAGGEYEARCAEVGGPYEVWFGEDG